MFLRFTRHTLLSTRRAASLLRGGSAWLLFALTLTACENEIADSFEQEELQLTTQWDGEMETRATVDNTWSGSEKITVMAGGYTKTYTAQTDGTLNPDSTGPLRWTRGDTMHVSAYYAPKNGLTTTFKIETGQNKDEGFKISDALYAPPTVVNYGNTAALAFKHLCALVNLTVTAGDDLEDINMSNAYISFMNQQNVSGTVNRTTGAVEQRTLATSSIYITPQGVGTASSDKKQVRALLVPQKGSGVKFVKVDFRDDKSQVTASYSYTPSESFPLNLEAGKTYTFNLRLTQHGDLVLYKHTINDWSIRTDQVTSTLQ
jgi:hypothetical protein